MPRRASYVLAAALLALGAPLGLLLLRALRGGGFALGALGGELARDGLTYAYVAVSTMLAFCLFGYVLGRQADQLYELSSIDALTGLHNRRIAQERLHEECARVERYGGALALLLVDLDGLKAINDRSGHRAGDLALKRVAEAIRSGARSTDVAARWGGDEFMVLVPSAGEGEARHLAERIRAFAMEEVVAGGPAITVSVGVAVAEPTVGPLAAEMLVRAADAALYEAKRAGRNRVVVAR
jgi:diguanylate cyclase (GGDEF)-like protein